jgi:hypothetical protein
MRGRAKLGHFVIDGVVDRNLVRSRMGVYAGSLDKDGGLMSGVIAEAYLSVTTQRRDCLKRRTLRQ